MPGGRPSDYTPAIARDVSTFRRPAEDSIAYVSPRGFVILSGSTGTVRVFHDTEGGMNLRTKNRDTVDRLFHALGV
jgi:hypothetical protein